MQKMFRAAIFAVPFVFAAGLASADEPMQLTDNQLDGVTASGDAFANATAAAFGANTATTHTFTDTAAVADLTSIISSQLSKLVPIGVAATAMSEAAAN
jgi:hypothetical protein